MKDIIAHSSVSESYDYIQSLWENRFFRESAYIQGWAMKAAERKPLFFTMTHPDLEWAHFTSYLCCVALREYENPAIRDLYFLHELIHVAKMPHEEEIDFYNWRTGVFRNELLASMNSEVYAYFEIPELRKASFNHEIWADRFLIHRWKSFYKDNPKSAHERLRRQRKLVSTNPNPSDFIEQQIAGYFHQNILWAEVWREIYSDLGQHMRAYILGEITSEEHKLWIEANYEEAPAPIPFYQQALEFSRPYRQNRRNLGNQNISKGDR